MATIVTTETAPPAHCTARAVCEYCGRKTRWTETEDGRLWIDQLPRGWSVTPYPPTLEHSDGTHGDRFACPEHDRAVGIRSLGVEGTERKHLASPRR
jgi:hypothetical protein